MAGSQKRAYGKGGTASSRAVLNDLFLDENDINEQMSSLSLGQAGAHLSSKEDDEPVPAVTNPVPVIPVARKGKGAESDPVSILADSKLSLYGCTGEMMN